MAWKSLRPDMAFSGVTLTVDQKNGNTVGEFRVTERALYLPGKRYIPLDAVEKFNIRDDDEDGKPAFAVAVYFGLPEPERLIFEKKRDAQMLAYLLMSSRQGIKWEE